MGHHPILYITVQMLSRPDSLGLGKKKYYNYKRLTDWFSLDSHSDVDALDSLYGVIYAVYDSCISKYILCHITPFRVYKIKTSI